MVRSSAGSRARRRRLGTAALGAGLAILLAGCLSLRPERVPPPEQLENLCALFDERPHWWQVAQRAQRRWGTPAPVAMAFIYHESAFVATARPPKRKLLGILPWARASTAYGYSQALDVTWRRYQNETGNHRHRRDRFADAVEFIGWYNDVSARDIGLAKHDARRLYLAYHEGQGGYRRGSHLRKAWLLAVAQRVAQRAQRYQRQLSACRKESPSLKDRFLDWFR